MRKKVLFLCTHNSCRSQMAEGLVNHFLSQEYEAFSAGTEATSVNKTAIRIMAEIGIDISGQRSKTLDEYKAETFDYVITLCDAANETCPLFFGGVQRVHLGFIDPSAATGTEEAVLAEFRRVRDSIKETLLDFLGATNR